MSRGKASAPTPAQVREARATLTTAQAAALVYVTQRAWQLWEAGRAPMPRGLYELARCKILGESVPA